MIFQMVQIGSFVKCYIIKNAMLCVWLQNRIFTT